MTSVELFVELLHRLRHYDDAVVLYALLMRRTDQMALRTSATRIALDQLQGHISRQRVRRSLIRLQALGLIDLRARERYRTRIGVEPDALHVFLRLPIPRELPGRAEDAIAFLQSLTAQNEGQGLTCSGAWRSTPHSTYD